MENESRSQLAAKRTRGEYWQCRGTRHSCQEVNRIGGKQSKGECERRRGGWGRVHLGGVEARGDDPPPGDDSPDIQLCICRSQPRMSLSLSIYLSLSLFLCLSVSLAQNLGGEREGRRAGTITCQSSKPEATDDAGEMLIWYIILSSGLSTLLHHHAQTHTARPNPIHQMSRLPLSMNRSHRRQLVPTRTTRGKFPNLVPDGMASQITKKDESHPFPLERRVAISSSQSLSAQEGGGAAESFSAAFKIPPNFCFCGSKNMP
jgi:hypothetical protein